MVALKTAESEDSRFAVVMNAVYAFVMENEGMPPRYALHTSHLSTRLFPLLLWEEDPKWKTPQLFAVLNNLV
jgi:hypothetical protein